MWKFKRYEASIGIGPSSFYGDIGGYSQSKNVLGLRDITLKQIRFDVSGNFKYRITQEFSVRLCLSTGLLQATDKRGSNEGRGFKASTFFVESDLIAEYYFIKNKAESSYLFTKGQHPGFITFIKKLDFYALTGIGGVGYTVKGNNRLETFGMHHGGFAGVIPVGLGSTLIYSPNINFGVEFTARYSLSDYIDGYTSQYSNSNDVYYFFNFTVSYKMRTGPKGWPILKRR
jgi:hypothetical protein